MKKINWESWNAIEEDIVAKINEKRNIEPPELIFDERPESQILEFPPSPIFETPFGSYNVDSSFKPSSRWECWIGHTNFNVSANVVNVINKTEGVESVVVMGRYTFCVAIKKQLFNSREVRDNIQDLLCINSLSIQEIKQKLNEYKYWSLLIHNDGRTDFVYSNDDNSEFNNLKQKLEEKKNKHGGTIFNSQSICNL